MFAKFFATTMPKSPRFATIFYSILKKGSGSRGAERKFLRDKKGGFFRRYVLELSEK